MNIGTVAAHSLSAVSTRLSAMPKKSFATLSPSLVLRPERHSWITALACLAAEASIEPKAGQVLQSLDLVKAVEPGDCTRM